MCCHFLLQTKCLCFFLHSYLQQVINGSILTFELHVPHQYQKEGAGAPLHPWRFPGHRDGNPASLPRFLMSFSHLWSPEPTGPACPADIDVCSAEIQALISLLGIISLSTSLQSPWKQQDAPALSPPVPVTTNPTPALQAEETQPQFPQTSTKSLALFSRGSTAQSCRPVPGVIYRNRNWPTHAHAEKTSPRLWTCNTQTIIS